MAHGEINVQDLDCDFLASAGKKMLGPTGVVCCMEIKSVETCLHIKVGVKWFLCKFRKDYIQRVPYKFEAGTPNVAGRDCIWFSRWVTGTRLTEKQSLKTNTQLMIYASEKLKAVDGVRLIGTAKKNLPLFSFVIDELNALDVGMYSWYVGSCSPHGTSLHRAGDGLLQNSGTIRASFLSTTTKEELM